MGSTVRPASRYEEFATFCEFASICEKEGETETGSRDGSGHDLRATQQDVVGGLFRDRGFDFDYRRSTKYASGLR